MAQKKLSKTKIRSNRYHYLLERVEDATSKCINSGVCISPQCLIDKSKWRIVVEFKNKDGGIIGRKESDPSYYYDKEDLDLKIMELYLFYSGRV